MQEQQSGFLAEPTLQEWQAYLDDRFRAAEQSVSNFFIDLIFVDKVEFPQSVESLRGWLLGTPELEEDFNEIVKRDFGKEIITLQDVAVFLHRYKDAEFASYGDGLRDRGDEDGFRLYRSIVGMMPK